MTDTNGPAATDAAAAERLHDLGPDPTQEQKMAELARLGKEVARLRREMGFPRESTRRVPPKEKTIAMNVAYRRGYRTGAQAALRAFITGTSLDRLRTWSIQLDEWQATDSARRTEPPRPYDGKPRGSLDADVDRAVEVEDPEEAPADVGDEPRGE